MLYQLFWLFLAFSFLGWCLEVAATAVRLGQYRDRGGLNGQLCLVYGSTGVCQVLSIDQRQDYVNGVKQSRLYYQLKPLYQGGVIYTPVDNDKVVMRPVISREDAETLIDSIPTLRPAVCPAATTQALTQHYQTSLRRHSCRSLMELTMSIHQKRCKAEAQNRRLGMVDERFMKQAEQLLFGELAAALDIPYDEVQPYIANRMQTCAKV